MDLLQSKDDIERIWSKISSVLCGKKGAIFDMDGTLLDSMGMWGNLDFDYMRGLGLEPGPDFQKDVAVLTLPTAAEYVCSHYPVPYTPKQVLEQFMEIAYAHYSTDISAKKMIPELIGLLYERGIRMVVATANEYDMSVAALERNGLMRYMEEVVTCTMAGAGKESPAVYLKACELLQVDVSECVVFEDSLFAVQTAKAAGFSVVGVYEEMHREDWNLICDITDGQVVFE